MADFDAIYEDDVLDEGAPVVVAVDDDDDRYVALVPDPIIIRGAGNMTV